MEPNPNVQIDPPPVAAPTSPPEPTTTNTVDLEAKARRKQLNAQLCALSKTFGHIPNVPIFTQWAKRLECSGAAVHRSAMAGICGNKVHGVYSVALSNSYHDDQDGGDVIFYTGVGGRERWTNAVPPKRLRVGPQTKDQSWLDRENQALQRSFETGNPVRVIRSSKCASQYAPVNGYRYDGLYKVAAWWTAKGHNGKDICRCRLERLPDQPPIPLRPITISASRRRRERLVSTPPWPSLQKESNAGGEFEESPNGPDVRPTQQLSSQPMIPPDLSTRPRYRFDPNTHELVRVRPDVIPAAEMNEEEHRAEDDATLAPSEDGYANEGMDTAD